MDSGDEDVSARVLLRRVLHTELPRSPVTRSVTNVRRSGRFKHTPGLESPGVALRHRLKQKLHESTQSPLPPPKRQRSTGEKTNPPAVATPPLYDDDITTRGLLRGIIQMDTDASLLMSGQPAVQEADPHQDSSVSSAGEKTEGLSGEELSDLTLHTEPLTHVVKGLSRRKTQRAFSVSAFERQLDELPDKSVEEGSVPQEKQDVSQDLDFSAGSKSGLNLTLKTPFVEKHTERAGLQRKVSNRRLPSVDAFDEAVQKCLEQAPHPDHSEVQDGKTLEDSSWQKFTLGLNDVTELYEQPAGSNVLQKKDETVVPDAEMERDVENEEESALETVEEESQENKQNYVDEIQDVFDSESVIQENHDCDVEFVSREEEIVTSSREAEYCVSVSPEDDIMLAPTQAMIESAPEPHDVEEHDLETEEDIGEENVQEDADTSQDLERITRRAHRSEGGGAVLAFPPGQRVTKSLGAGLNPREKDLLEFGNRSREDVPDEEVEQQGSLLSPPLYPAAEVTTEQSLQQPEATLDGEDVPVVEGTELTTSEQRSQHETSLSEKELPDTEEGDPQEVENQSEDEDMIDCEPANQSPELHSPAQSEQEEVEEEEEGDEEDDDDDAHSEELSMKTPAFVKQKRMIGNASAQATPTVLKELSSGPAPQVVKRRPRQKREKGSDVLPKSYVMSVFKHFAKTKVASDIYPAINEILKKYYERLADDLEVYATHAKRKTIEMEDFELLMRRQGFVTDSMPINILIEKYLPLEYRKLLIPVATSGNKVVPNRRR
ncbi:centromere protein T [Triplophysa dalaica]|uniref:centromere protein T n=1 Tax=Triplophysa dalaica TaxID=1582913 RepID=UPI0024E0183F|nr:centromere protein T [Triplophysa dalaica]XP_056587340.1 centromere protein T [Triplophysa dalaica]